MRDKVDEATLGRMLSWTGELPGFKESHAVDSLFVAQRYMGERATSDREALLWLALDVTFWYWVDDQTDESLHLPVGKVDWRALFSDIEGGLRSSSTPESLYLSRLGQSLLEFGGDQAGYEWWLQSAASTLAAFRAGEHISRTKTMPTFVEYLEVGSWSSTVRNILATASVLYRMDWVARRAGPNMSDLERYLGLVARLENDAYGFEKERKEGCFANAVLLMEQFMPTATARAFVEAQKQAYEALLLKGLQALPAEDSFVRFVNAVLEAHRAWYQMRPARYDQAS